MANGAVVDITKIPVIYIVTMVHRGNLDDDDASVYDSTLNALWMPTFEGAAEQLVSNSSLLSDDGYYQFAIISPVHYGALGDGMFTDEDDYKFYQYNGEKSEYESIKQPKWAQGIIAWWG